MPATEIKKSRSSGKALAVTLLVLLWVVCVGSAIGVVYSTHESRKATQKLEKLKREASGLHVISGQYLLEKSSWSAYSVVEKKATEQLNMISPSAEQTVLVFKE